MIIYNDSEIEKMLSSEYYISSSEGRELIGSFKVLCEAVERDSFFSMSATQKFEDDTRKSQEVENKKNQAAREHKNKGLLKRAFTSPEHVWSHSSGWNYDDTPKAYRSAMDAEDAFSHICRSHKIDPTKAFQNIVSLISGGQMYADRYRAFQRGKQSSAIMQAMRR